MDEAVFLTLANVDEGSIDAGEDILNGAEIDVTDLIAALGHHQFIHTVVGENCGNTQLLGDDDLLRHGKSGDGSPEASRRGIRKTAPAATTTRGSETSAAIADGLGFWKELWFGKIQDDIRRGDAKGGPER
jgi:hypothetical protein